MSHKKLLDRDRKPSHEWTPCESSKSQGGMNTGLKFLLVQKALEFGSGLANTKIDETSLSINC